MADNPIDYDPHMALTYLLMRRIEDNPLPARPPDPWSAFWQKCAMGALVIIVGAMSFLGQKVLTIENEQSSRKPLVHRIEPMEERLHRLEVDTERLKWQITINQQGIDAIREALARVRPARGDFP